MSAFSILVVILGCSLFMVVAADKDISAKGYRFRILGRSGKIMFFKEKDASGDKKKVKVEFNGIEERDASGKIVGKGGKKKHVFNTFANQQFTFTGPVNTTLQGVNCKQLNFSATLPGPDAKFTVVMYLFTEDGDLVNGEESSSVVKGDLKFNIMIDSWTFCGSGGDDCKDNKDEVGEEVCLFAAIKGGTKERKPENKGKAKGKNKGRATRRPDKYGIGGTGSVSLSDQCVIDGNEKTLAKKPAVIVKGGKSVFQFCFPRFNHTIVYDPTLSLDQPEDNGSVRGTISVSLMVLALFFSVFKFAF